MGGPDYPNQIELEGASRKAGRLCRNHYTRNPGHGVNSFFAPSAFLNGWRHLALLAPLPIRLPTGPRFGDASGQTSAAGLLLVITWNC